MRTVRFFAAAIALTLAMSTVASAEESFLSKLNPFGGSSKPKSSAQNRPGSYSTPNKRKPQKSMIGKTVDTVTKTTRTAWNKTTSALNPMRLMPGSKAKPAKNKT